MGHTLADVSNEVGRNSHTNFMFVHQLDPEAIDINKIKHFEAQGTDHTLQYPDQLLEHWHLVPVEVGLFNRKLYEAQAQN